ncbi:MAG: peptidoglycan bridge formation glycyltransferase FemA/FemB family protein [Bacilli bacterium]|nr:peptidoglycan bridge formation glycyltransferase FemA/FemB family protein [Bacilli bacterium]
MLKLKNLEKEKFDEFVRNHKTKSHFLQSLSWGEFSKIKKNLTPYYLGLVNEEDEILASVLLLEKKLPMNKCYFYAPRGFVIDYKRKDLVREMTKKVVAFAKSKKAIFVKIDPDIIKESTNYQNEKTENPDYDTIFQTLKSCGFKHQGYTKNFETMQPRYTFRIDLTQDLEEIENHFSKTTKQRIAKAEKLNTEVVIGTKKDLKDFYYLMTLTESRKDFISYNEDYYETLYEIFNGNPSSKATLFLGKINFQKTIKALEKNQKTINDQISILPIDNLSKSAKAKLEELTRQKENVLAEIEKYKEAKTQYGNEVTLSAHMIIEYGNKAWVLYAGNHNILSETYVNYSTYFEHIKYCKNKGIEIYDQFGTIGDLSKNNPRLGLHEFKKKFGGDYVEFIGEWDYITNPLFYFVFTKLVPIYRKIIRNKSKKDLENELNKENKKEIE